jgi:hypothetical protein
MSKQLQARRTVGVDVQKDRLELTVVDWGAGEEAWTHDHIILSAKLLETGSRQVKQVLWAQNRVPKKLSRSTKAFTVPGKAPNTTPCPMRSRAHCLKDASSQVVIRPACLKTTR